MYITGYIRLEGFKSIQVRESVIKSVKDYKEKYTNPDTVENIIEATIRSNPDYKIVHISSISPEVRGANIMYYKVNVDLIHECEASFGVTLIVHIPSTEKIEDSLLDIKEMQQLFK